MSPYVIDGKKRAEYIYLFFIFITISFGLGYTLGYLHGVPAEESSVTGALQPSSDTADVTAPLQPVAESGTKDQENIPEDIDSSRDDNANDSPEVAAKNPQTNTKQQAAPATPPQPAPAKAAVKETVKPQKVTPESMPAVSKTTIQSSNKSSAPENEKTIEESSKTSPATEAMADAVDNSMKHYLIQVGLFSSKENASAFVAQLESNGFKAFYERFTSTSGDEKYNVRLGPFTEKEMAQERLAEFQKSHDTSAYILSNK